MTTQELRELDEWIAINLFGWTDFLPENIASEYDLTGTPPNWSDAKASESPANNLKP